MDIDQLLTKLYEKKFMTSRDIAESLFNGNMNRAYLLLSEAQKRRLVTSKRRDIRGSHSPKIYKITRLGMRSIKADPDQTPNFPLQSDYMRRQLVIEEIKTNLEQRGWSIHTGEQAIEKLAEYIAQQEGCQLYLAKAILPMRFTDTLAMPPMGTEAKPLIYIVPNPSAFTNAVLTRIRSFREAKYIRFIVIPITPDQHTAINHSNPIKEIASIIPIDAILK